MTTTALALVASTVEIDKARNSAIISLMSDVLRMIFTIIIVILHIKNVGTTRHHDDRCCHPDDQAYAKGKDNSKDCNKGGHQAHQVDASDRKSSCSCSVDSSNKEVKRINAHTPRWACSHNSSSRDPEEHYHVEEKGGFPNDVNASSPSQWVRKPVTFIPRKAKSPKNDVPPAMFSSGGWKKKPPPEEPVVTVAALAVGSDTTQQSQQRDAPVLLYYDICCEEKPCWYLEASSSQEPHHIKSQGEAIGWGSFFKCRA